MQGDLVTQVEGLSDLQWLKASITGENTGHAPSFIPWHSP
jgi:hypothetical protein